MKCSGVGDVTGTYGGAKIKAKNKTVVVTIETEFMLV